MFRSKRSIEQSARGGYTSSSLSLENSTICKQAFSRCPTVSTLHHHRLHSVAGISKLG